MIRSLPGKRPSAATPPKAQMVALVQEPPRLERMNAFPHPLVSPWGVVPNKKVPLESISPAAGYSPSAPSNARIVASDHDPPEFVSSNTCPLPSSPPRQFRRTSCQQNE